MNARILGAFGVLLLAANLHGQRIDTVMTNLNLSEPRGITTDGSASYIADSGNNQILKYTREGLTTVLAGKSGTSGRGYKDDLGTKAMFDDPQGIVYSAARNGLVVADYGNSVIRLVDLTTRQVTTIGGVRQQSGTNDGANGVSQYSFPTGVDTEIVDTTGLITNVFYTNVFSTNVMSATLTSGDIILAFTNVVFTNSVYTNSSDGSYGGLADGGTNSGGATFKNGYTNGIYGGIIFTNVAFTQFVTNFFTNSFGVTNGFGVTVVLAHSNYYAFLDAAASYTNGSVAIGAFTNVTYVLNANAAFTNVISTTVTYSQTYSRAVSTKLVEIIYVADFGNGLIRTLDGNNQTHTYVDLSALASTKVSGPTAVAVGNPGDLWVADAYNNVVWRVVRDASGTNATPVAGQFDNQGADDADIGTEGRLSEPWGILWRGWLGDSADLIVSDTGNNTLRRIFTNSAPDVQAYSLATFSGTPGQAGSVDGVIASATFNRPMGLSRGPSSGTFYIADSASSRIRIYTERTQPVQVLADPQIGYLTYDSFNDTYVFNPVTGSSKLFHNDPIAIVMMQSQNEPITYIQGQGPNLASVRDPIYGDSKLTPWTSGSGGSGYNVANNYPDMIVKAIAEKTDGSTPSKVAHAEFIYQVGMPIVNGFNAANLRINNETTQFTPITYYTLSDNGNDPPTPDFKDTVNSTKLTSTNLSLSIVADTVLWVKAFDPAEVAGKTTHYQSSDTTKIKLGLTDYQANQLVWGFESDEGSSQFIGTMGQNFYAPIALILVPGQTIYSFQFDAWIVGNVNMNDNGADVSALDPTNNIVFRSDLKTQLGSPIEPGNLYKNLVPTYADNNSVSPPTKERIYTVAVQWGTSLDTNAFDLVAYSMPHDILHTSKEGGAFMGSLGFSIPMGALTNSIYQIQLDNVSGIGESKRSIPIQVVTSGSLSGGVSNKINSIKQVVLTNQSPKFLVGSALPFRWFNAGDFGSGTNNIGAGDVIQTLEAAILVNLPTNCDMYYALDSAPNDLYTNWGIDADRERAALDGLLGDSGLLPMGARIGPEDVYATFRRSSDPSLKWFFRRWENGRLNTHETPNLLAKPTNIISAVSNIRRASPKVVSSGPHSLKIRGSDLQTSPGKTLLVPINAEILGDAPVRTLLLSMRVVALDGSPEITDPISYDEADTLVTASKASKFTLPRGPNIFSAAWLDNSVEGVFGTNPIGTLLIHLPSNATADSAYLVHFDKFSASPNGLAIFPSVVEDTLVTLSNRTGSSWNDGIPDAWRLRYFSTVSNDLSAASADADGDGFSNLQEYLAGTNPMDPFSKPQSQPPNRPTLGLVGVTNNPIPTFTMQWLSETGRSYFVETSQEAFGTNWMMISTNLPGSGAMTQFTDTNATGATRFYRVRAQ